MTAPQRSLIHRLPPELILDVTKHLDVNSLGHLRQTCTEINIILLQYFDRKFFRIRRCMIEHESLEALQEIACHPRLARAVEQVDFYNCIYDDHAEGYMEDALEFWKRRVEHGYLPRETLISTGQAQAMLIKSFSNFPNLHTTRMLGLSERSRSDSPRPWGWSHDPAVDRSMNMPTEDVECSGLVPMMLSALGRTQARPTTIEISLRDSRIFPGNAFIFPNKLEVLDVLKNVQVLGLNLGSEIDPRHYMFRGDTYLEDLKSIFEIPLRAIMHRFTSLHTLSVSFKSGKPLASSFLGWLAGYKDSMTSRMSTYLQIASPRLATLSTLELGPMLIGIGELLAVCSRFLLTSLILKQVGFLRQSTTGPKNYWRVFFSKLAKALRPESRLCHVSFCRIGQRIEDLRLDPRNPFEQDWQYIAWVPLPGRHNVDRTPETNPLHSIEYDKTTASESVPAWLARIAPLARLSEVTSRPH